MADTGNAREAAVEHPPVPLVGREEWVDVSGNPPVSPEVLEKLAEYAASPEGRAAEAKRVAEAQAKAEKDRQERPARIAAAEQASRDAVLAAMLRAQIQAHEIVYGPIKEKTPKRRISLKPGKRSQSGRTAGGPERV